MAENIIIKQEYFDNIKTAIDGLNEFFTSGFKVKNFPSVDGDVQLESTLERIVSRLDGVDPTWMEDPNMVNDVIQTISDNLKNINPADGVYATVVNSNNETMISAIDAYVGFKMLQYIADHFQDFGKFVNGIYTFEMFTKPSQYTDVMDVFGKFIEFDEIPELDLEEKVFDEGAFVDGLMKLSQVDFPESMTIETETERIINRQDLEGIDVFVDDSVQEAAEINYFENTKPSHIKYNEKSNKWMISKQFEKTVNDLVAALRKCDTTDDLKDFFSGDFWKDVKIDPCEVVAPFILVNVMDNTKKFPYDTFNTEKYSDSYASIIKNNNGAKRFQNYDLFSTFKSDKDGTIQFIEDFLKLNLVNKEDASVNNNTLLTLFNIFDSRIYLDIMYNMLPDKKKEEKTEDEFVKEIRARINKNSKSKNAYADTDVKDESVTEYVARIIDEFGDASISDMMYCEQFYDAVMAEIDTVDNRIYNAGISPFIVDAYIGESYKELNEHLDDVFTEANVHKQRENLQSCVSSLMAEMERIVELDRKHQWNNNTFVDSYKTTAGMLLTPIFANITGSTKAHTDIKQVYKYTRKALKGKSGNLTSEQKSALRKLHDLVGDLWANVKIFWVNPINWPKKMNLLRNDRKQDRVKHIADIAKRIVDMKNSLDFLQDEDFVVEAWYDGSSDYIFQEATTEKNHEMLALAIKLLMKDMKSVVELSEKKQWTNNACISKFRTASGTHGHARRSEAYTNLKQAMKYVNAGIAGAAGIPNESDKDTLKTLLEKLKEMQREIRKINFDVTKALGANIKESNAAHKIATLAKDIVGMESDLGFVNDAPVKGSKTDAEGSNDDTSVQEAFIQEGKQTHYRRTLKRFDYDPKTNTIKTDIDLPDKKEKMRVKLIIDDSVGLDGAYVTLNNDNEPEIHISRRELKQKGYKSAYYLKHEEGHIAHGDPHREMNSYLKSMQKFDDSITLVHEPSQANSDSEYNKAKKFVDDNGLREKLLEYDNDHDSDPAEFRADKYAADHTSKIGTTKALMATRKETPRAFKKNERYGEDSVLNNEGLDLGLRAREEYINRHVKEYETIIDFDQFRMIMEAYKYKGEIPSYLDNRIKMSDDVGKTTLTTVPLPDDVPANDLGELTGSIDAKLDAGGDLGDMLGSGYESNPNKGDHEGKVVINVTNNYNNSFNKDSGNTNTTTTTVDDHSSGKVTNTTHTNSHNNTNSRNDSSHDNRSDSSTRKSESSSSRKNYSDHSKSTNTKGSNNNNNSNESVDTKDSRITEKDNEQKLSSGKTIQEMFMFLESKEPQSIGNGAGKPPKEDSLTKAMDRDRRLLATQQKGKKGVQKIVNTGKAVLKPVSRAKQWLTGVVESLIRRDENQVKAEIIENRSYRSMLYKATRLALHLGMIGVATTIQPYLGVALVGVEGLRLADKQRLKKEAQRELETEINIIDEKIRDLESMDTTEARKEKYEYMRKKSELESMLIQAPRSVVKHPRSAW